MRGRRNACAVGLALLWWAGTAAGQFAVTPYVQAPAPTGMTVRWFAASETPGALRYWPAADPAAAREVAATVTAAPAVAPHAKELPAYGKTPPPPLWRHEVVLTGLAPASAYAYSVRQGAAAFAAAFRTPPAGDAPVHFIAYGDSETEPESTGARVAWPDPAGLTPKRLYLIDQTRGLANQLAVVRARGHDFLLICGDFVETGGEQRDWDEFWRQHGGPDAAQSLAARVPILPVLGNHDYYLGGMRDAGVSAFSATALARWGTYFAPPDMSAGAPPVRTRYYRYDCGPVTLLVLDVCNGQPHQSERDTNHYWDGATDEERRAHDFNPGSAQYAWLERQLADAQRRARFTFVATHHAPWSSGVHGYDQEDQPGAPVRVLLPLLLKHGVAALFSGHDEMYEHSVVTGAETRPDGTTRAATLHLYDVGIAGDGLRGPSTAPLNPHRRFLAHADAPEEWVDGVLRRGGKHYGHLDVDVQPTAAGTWEAVLTPRYVLPTKDPQTGEYTKYEVLEYADVVRLPAK